MRSAKINAINKIGFALIFVLQLLVGSVNAQTFRVKSIQNKPVVIKLYHHPASENLLITSLQDTIRLNNFWSLDTVTVQDKIFLKIDYAVRVGSNTGRVNQLWLFVDRGLLKPALYIESYREFDYRPNEYSSLKVSTKLRGSSVNNYVITLNVKELNHKSGRSISNIIKTDRLRFDMKAGCFCNDSIFFKNKYTFKRANSRLSDQRFLSQTVPIVNISKNKYYFISNNWYTRYKGTFYAMAQY